MKSCMCKTSLKVFLNHWIHHFLMKDQYFFHFFSFSFTILSLCSHLSLQPIAISITSVVAVVSPTRFPTVNSTIPPFSFSVTMQNSPSFVAAPPPLPLPPPSRPTYQINVIPFLPPPPFVGAPNSIFQIIVLPFPPPPPFAGPEASLISHPSNSCSLSSPSTVLRPPSTVTTLVAALVWEERWRSDERGTSNLKKM